MTVASPTPTPFAVRCRTHGLVYLTESAYIQQLDNAYVPWSCPVCERAAEWDDCNYDDRIRDYQWQGERP